MKRIQRRPPKGWRIPPGAIYVGRPSRWGNPFPVARNSSELFSPEDSVRMFREWLATGEAHFGGCLLIDKHRITYNLRRERLLADLTLLRGHDLACWCPLDQPCHADVLLELAG